MVYPVTGYPITGTASMSGCKRVQFGDHISYIMLSFQAGPRCEGHRSRLLAGRASPTYRPRASCFHEHIEPLNCQDIGEKVTSSRGARLYRAHLSEKYGETSSGVTSGTYNSHVSRRRLG